MPTSPAARMIARADSAPCRWPSMRGSPRCLAQRPLPSMMMATCWGSEALASGARWGDVLTSCLHKLKTHLIAIKNNARSHRQRAADSFVVLMCDDHPYHALPVLGQFFLHVTHVAKRLPNHRIAGPAFL